ncbi:MAG: hypothetical protein LQ352_001346 [Teloschistes flavicans]|nr:MAG: hypothetical protein LQ352_001346 [Teloschistes flavicans]
MQVARFAALVLAVSTAVATPIYRRDVDFNWGSTKVRGVNIGGWLVLEPWITPSIFQAYNGSIVDEWTLCQNVPNASDILRQHWDSWVSLSDFQKIKAAGFNTVRIPVGYWAYKKFDNDPYIQGAAPYIDNAIGWARQTGLKVWIDLHGAPLSQNGYDNSGHLIKSPQTPGWTQGDSVNQTLAVIQLIANKYAQQSYQDVVVAIELLNEPLASALTGGTNAVIQYYNDGYGDVRKISNTPVMLHDAFQNGSFWDGVLAPPAKSGVVIDHHEYQVFKQELLNISAADHRKYVCTNSPTYAGSTSHRVVVGEWSAAMTDCAAGLNGWHIGARYAGYYPGSTRVGSCDSINFIETWDQQLKTDTQLYIAAQISVFEQKTNGWVFWNFKTEASPEWDLFRLLDNKIFPQPLDSLSAQSGICNV